MVKTVPESQTRLAALRTGEVHVAESPPSVAAAPIAALMSSGPDHPEPLSQFVAADPGTGLVTGHRFAHAQEANGVAFNQDALDRMMSGASVNRAVDAVLDENRHSDVGLIGIDVHGNIRARNTDVVANRMFWSSGGRPCTQPRSSAE